MRGVTYGFTNQANMLCISTHTPHARRDETGTEFDAGISISTHTPHARRDGRLLNYTVENIFQLTRLMRGVTNCAVVSVFQVSFQLTRLMRGVTYFG